MSIELHNGDCLEVMATIESGSVDAIICDPPYGTMNTDGGRKLGVTGWDDAIDHAAMLDQCNRILRPNGALVLFAQQPYTTKLISDTHGNLPFSYCMTWVKDSFANALGCKKAPVNYTEDVCVFRCKKGQDSNHDFDGIHPLRPYAKAVCDFIGRTKKQVFADMNGQGLCHFMRHHSSQFQLCTVKTYTKLEELYDIGRMADYLPYGELADRNKSHKDAVRVEREKYLADFAEEYPTVFNLPPDAKYKSNVLEYSKDYRGEHPTQKPVALMEDLVYTYTNEGDTVLDFTMGSGTTGVACVNLGRSFIGIERDEGYFTVAKERISMAECPADEAQGQFEL